MQTFGASTVPQRKLPTLLGMRGMRSGIKGLASRLLDARHLARSNTRPSPIGGQVAQLVEQRTENPRVGGSIPPLATNKISWIREALLLLPAAGAHLVPNLSSALNLES
jgi:hypothetical protein